MKTLGNWISSESKHPFLLRRTFTVDRPLAAAEADLCGLGQFTAYLNGRQIGDHVLDPGWTDYRKYTQYVHFDVTDLVQAGENVFSAEVGNGWYILDKSQGYSFAFPPFMPPNPNPYKPFGNSLLFAMRLRLKYADGTEDVIEGDDSFRTHSHSVLVSNVYGTEIEDGRLRQQGWMEPGFDDSGWKPAALLAPAADAEPLSFQDPVPDVPHGELRLQTQPPIRVLKRYTGVKCGTIPGGEKGGQREIYDLGQNISGILHCRVQAEQANREVQIRLLLELVDEMVKNSLPEWMSREAENENAEETGACRDYDDFFSRTKYTVPEGVLDENGRMEAWGNDLVIRYLDRVVVKDDGYEVAFKAGVTVEVEV